MTETPPDDPAGGAKRDWRPWEANRKKKQRALHVSDEDWADFTEVAAHEGAVRNDILNSYIRRHIKAFRRKNPNVRLPSDRHDA